MSDLITTSQDAYRNACITTFCALISAGQRVKDEARGQTAAEYMGVLLLVGAIITVVVTSGVGGHLKTAIFDAIDNISNQKPDCSKANC
jgi:hypothetical protein